MHNAGNWKFLDKAQPSVTPVLIKLTTGNQSEIRAAFTTAAAALTVVDNKTLFGYDESGREYRYNQTGILS